MTQQDIDQGILNVVIGVATVKPAEFVIIRIGSFAKDHPCARLLARRHHDRVARYALRVADGGIPGAMPDICRARQRRNAENIETLRSLEQPQPALLRFKPRA